VARKHHNRKLGELNSKGAYVAVDGKSSVALMEADLMMEDVSDEREFPFYSCDETK
jgi:hypothetical protein